LKIDLISGVLELNYDSKLQELVDFGSRINKKRGFLFVSKVLGKHLPTKPSIMKKTYRDLANLIPSSTKPTLYIGFAETATALGQGVFEEMSLEDSFYIHSTRFQTSQDILLSFYEEHCHAPSHIFYTPKDDKLLSNLKNIQRVILIDDEVSTGNTANNLVIELNKVLPNVDEYYLLTILNWSKVDYPNFKYLSLYQGEFDFSPKDIEYKTDIVSQPKELKNLDDIIPYNFGRYGTDNLNLDFSSLIDYQEFIGKRVLVLGTAEFMYPPYLLAKYLEDRGANVYFQATTRSPVNVDKAIKSKISFKDNYFEDIDNFLYNVIDREYDKILVCYETTTLPNSFDLIPQLKNYFDVKEVFMNV